MTYGSETWPFLVDVRLKKIKNRDTDDWLDVWYLHERQRDK